MGNCASTCRKGRKPKRELTLAILGVDNAGKTTTTKGLLGEFHTDTTPTIGFNSETITISNYTITFFDLGGGKKIRDIWTQYIHEIYGLVYVVDSTATDRMEEIQHNLKTLLEHDKMRGKPILLLANKQDLETALDEVDIMEQLNLENIVNTNKCPCRIEVCSAIKGTGRKMDQNIVNGIKWLCGMIDHNWEIYDTRVQRDKEEDKKKRELEMQARRERVKKQREERERKEKEENERLGIKPEEEDDDDVDIIQGGPFRQLNVKELEKKEKKLKEEKKKRKEREQQLRGEMEKEEDDSDTAEVPRSARSIDRLGLYSSGLYSLNKSQNNNDSDEDAFPNVRKRDTPRLPPLQRPIGTKFNEESPVKKLRKKKKKPKLKALKENTSENDYDNEGNSSNLFGMNSSKRYKDINDDDEVYSTYKESVNSISKIEVNALSSFRKAKNSFHNDIEEEEEKEELRTNRKKKKKESKKETSFDGMVNGYGKDLNTPRTLGHDEDSDNDVTQKRNKSLRKTNSIDDDYSNLIRTNRKKKSYLKNNKTYPSDDESCDSVKDRDYSWTLSPTGERNVYSPREKNKKNKSPWQKKESPSHEIDVSISSTRNWGFAEDLPEIDELRPISHRRLRSNVDEEDDIVY